MEKDKPKCSRILFQQMSDVFLTQFLQKFSCVECSRLLDLYRRLPPCGHYFCEDCFDSSSKNCPNCIESFELLELAEEDVMSKAMKKVLYLKKVYEESQKNPENEVPSNDRAAVAYGPRTPKRITWFIYRNVKYIFFFMQGNEPKRNVKGETSLHTACKRDDSERVLALINSGEDLNARDYAGWVPLHEAIQAEAINIVEILIEKGAIINIPGPEYVTPLHKAFLKKNLPIIEYLLVRGANLCALDYNGKKPEDLNPDKEILATINRLMTSVEIKPLCHTIYFNTNIVAYCHSIDPKYVKILDNARSKFIKVRKFFNIWDITLTHVVVKSTHHLSCKILLGIAAGLILVPQEWINRWLAGDFSLPLDRNVKIIGHELANAGIKRSIVNKLSGRPRLFDGIRFFIVDHRTDFRMDDLIINKHFLELLIKAGGGEVLNRAPASRLVVCEIIYPYHCAEHDEIKYCSNFIIYEERYPPRLQYCMPELKHRTSRWLINTVITFSMSGVLPQGDNILVPRS